MLDVVDFISERGGNPEKIRDSQRRRYADVEIVDQVIALWEDHRKVQHGSHHSTIFEASYPKYSGPI